MELGRLKEVNVRDLWSHEQYSFSNWLAKRENIAELNDVLGLTLIDVDKEVYVGPYRCDLVAKDEASGITVVIENQLEKSDHEHLGKAITYAAGLDASVVVWIVTMATEEHRSAIEWLNNNTKIGLYFYLLELHAYKIGNSVPAPKFEPAEVPNDIIKNANIQTGNLTKAKAECLQFWNEFNEYIVSKGNPIHTRKATTDHWYTVAIGTSKAHISINLVNRESQIVVDLYIPDNKDFFDKLYHNRDAIEASLGFTLDWQRLNTSKASRIKYAIPGLDFDDHSNYPQLRDEILSVVLPMKKVFSKYK